MQQYLWKNIYTLYFIRIKPLYLYDKVIFNFLLYTLFYKGSILHVFLHSWDIISNVVYVLGHGGDMNFYFTLYIKWGSIKIKLTSLMKTWYFIIFYFNPLFHNVTPVAQRLRLAITRKINPKKPWNFFYK